MTEGDVKANALRNAAAMLIAGRSWEDAASEFGALDDSSMRDDQIKALDIIEAITQMFEGHDGEPSAAARSLLERLHQEVVPLAFRTSDGAAARALERIEDVAIQMRARQAEGFSTEAVTDLLGYLEDLGYPVREHWSQRVAECAELVVRVQVDGGQFRPGAAGLLADLLIGTDPVKYPDRKKLAGRLRAASKRGLKTM